MRITSPSAYQVVQRTGTNANIAVTGIVGPGTHTIEARWNGGTWTQISASATNTFSGVLTNQPQGQGTLEVRWADHTEQVAHADYVGIGDVFVIGGQSNAMGYGTENQTYSTTGFKATMLGFDYVWKELVDPISSSTGQIDYINNNGDWPSGSVWVPIATRYLTNQPCPIAFIPCPLNASAIAAWQPSGSHTNRASLYGSMIWRAKYASTGCKAVLWWQGESEAAYGASSYYQNLTNLSANIAADLGAKLIPCKLQTPTGSYPYRTDVNNAIARAWSEDANCATGPDLGGLTSDDFVHLRSNGNLSAAAELWWNSIKAAFY